MTSSPDPDADLFELAPCGLALLDRDYVVRRANAYFLDLCGRGEADLAGGLRFASVLSVAGRVFLQTCLQPELALAGRLEETALDIVRPDGVRVPVMLNAVQAAGGEGAPGQIRLAVWRAAAKRAYEAEVPKARRAASEAAQVKADFLANISHEIRTPLNGVIGLIGVLERTELSASQREIVDLIQSSGQTLERLVSDILDLSKVQAGGLTLDPHPFDLVQEMRGLVEMARLRARDKNLAFAYTHDPELEGRFLGDAVRLKQVVGNLTANAIKFTESGEVRVRLGLDDAGRVVIEVADTGIGFDAATQAGLFERFQQADAGITRRFGGTGLGLAISKALCELMGGGVSARSEPGVGSTFTVTLPLQRLAPAEDLPVQDVADQAFASAERLRVLLVEDNPVNQRVVQLILEPYDLDLTVASDGAEGVQAWRSADFDLVLMDMQMPVMDGLTAVREIRRLERETLRPVRTPIAILSANAMEEHRQQAAQAGADLHLAKPITPQLLLEGIQAALNGATTAPDALSA